MAEKYEVCLRLKPEESEQLATDVKCYRVGKTTYLRSLIMLTKGELSKI